MLSTVKQRLKFYIKSKNIKDSEFCRTINVSSGFIGSMVKSIQPDKIERITLKYPDLNISWLMTGEGDMLKQDAGDEGNKFIITDTPVGTPVYNIDATCGSLSRTFTNEEIVGYVDLPGIRKDSHIITACGDSMEPRIMNGDKIVLREVTSWSYFYFGQIYLILTDEYRMLKYVRKHKDEDYIILRSENKSYDDIELSKSEIIKLFVVENVLSIKNMM